MSVPEPTRYFVVVTDVVVYQIGPFETRAQAEREAKQQKQMLPKAAVRIDEHFGQGEERQR